MMMSEVPPGGLKCKKILKCFASSNMDAKSSEISEKLKNVEFIWLKDSYA